MRKSAGHQREGWAWRLRTLHQRSGSPQEYKYFARTIRQIVAEGSLLDYELTVESRNGDETIRARKQNATGKVPVVLPRQSESVSFLRLSLDTYERAKHVAAGHDVYFLYEQWKAACKRSSEHIRQPDKAFLAYRAEAANRSVIRCAS